MKRHANRLLSKFPPNEAFVIGHPIVKCKWTLFYPRVKRWMSEVASKNLIIYDV